MDMEAEMVYADILRTLQSSILNTNVSELRKLSRSPSIIAAPIVYRLIFTILCNLWFGVLKSLATINHQATEINRPCLILSVLITDDICMRGRAR